MTTPQRRVIFVLVIANIVFLAALLVFATSFSSSGSPLGLPSPVPVYRPTVHLSSACRRQTTQILSEAGFGGTATLVDETLRFDLVYRLRQGQDTEDVAQQIWTALDVALALTHGPCDLFSQIEIVIQAQGEPRATRVYAAVGADDLKAFQGGELSESAFIDRVHYQIEHLDDGRF